jgi:type IV secretion system protein VirB6
MEKIIQIFMLGILSFSIISCTDAECIDADDFGFSQVKIGAFEENPKGSGGTQYIDWQDSGLRLSGNNLHIVVKNWDPLKNINTHSELSAWCPWLGPTEKDYRPSLTEICVLLDDCYFENNESCTDGDHAKILNAPCLMKRGMGLYMLAAPRGFDPNESFDTNQSPTLADPRVIVAHMGSKTTDTNGNILDIYDLQIDPKNNSSYYVRTGGFLNAMTTQQKIDFTGGKLYFKILDNYYQDNSGQYIATIKSGVMTSEWDPTDWAIQMVKGFFFGNSGNDELVINETGVVKVIFNQVISNPSYKLMVSSLLTLSIMFYAFNFLIGNVKMSHQDLFFRVVKILIVSQLLTSATAWNFFNYYLFDFFINGSQSIISIIKASGGTGPGPSSIIAFMLAPHTIMKLFSLPLMSPITFGWSLLYLIIYFIALMVIFWGLFYAAVVYIVSIVMMGLIIALAPIFLCFLLFDVTRSLFENWLRQLISFSIQALLVVAAVTMVGITIRHQIYQTLGFRICKASMLEDITENAMTLKLRGQNNRSPIPYIWQPVYAAHEEDSGAGEQLQKILIPEAHFEGDKNNVITSNEKVSGKFCEAYECTGMRYPSFPFLDPTSESDLRRLRGFWKKDFAPVDAIWVLVICAVLLNLFMTQAAKIAQYIAGGTYNVSSVANESYQTLSKAVARPVVVARNYVLKKTLSGTYKGLKSLVSKSNKEQLNSEAKDNGDSVSRENSFNKKASITSTEGQSMSKSSSENASKDTSSAGGGVLGGESKVKK